MPKVIVIGAGMSGLMAARTLTDAGWQVSVCDKGRGVGGRMATRRIEHGTFDHGAQFFTVRDPRFQKWVDVWLSSNIVAEWTRGFSENDGHPRYRGTQGMTGIAKHLSAGLNVTTNERIMAVRAEADSWHIQSESGAIFSADALVMTPPVPQSLALLDAGGFVLLNDTRAALEKITYNPCIAIMALLERASAVPPPGGVQINAEPVWWVGDNMQKGISAVSALTIHAAPEFSRTHWETPPDECARLLLDAVRDFLGGANVVSHQVHKWRYSQPTVLHPERYLSIRMPLIVFAGDAFAGSRVEGAALSGLSAAEWLLGQM